MWWKIEKHIARKDMFSQKDNATSKYFTDFDFMLAVDTSQKW